MKALTISALLAITATATAKADTEKPTHLFILSGQSNMQRMDPETGFIPEAKKLFEDEEVVYIKVAKGGQPICRWLEEWVAIAKEKGLDEKHIKRIHKGGKFEFYQPILDQYQEMLEKHPKLSSVRSSEEVPRDTEVPRRKFRGTGYLFRGKYLKRAIFINERQGRKNRSELSSCPYDSTTLGSGDSA